MTISTLKEISLTTSMCPETLMNLMHRRVLFVDDPEQIHPTAIIGDGAVLTGDVRIGANTVVFYGTMLQGDTAPITIGQGCCIVDGVSMHNQVKIGDYVHIAHGALIHRRKTKGVLTIGSGTLIGFGAQVHESVGQGCQVAPGVIVDRPVPDHHFVYDKHLGDGLRQTIVSPMTPKNYDSVQAMYRNFWKRQIIYKGSLIPLMWYQSSKNGSRPGLEQAIDNLTSYFK